MNTHTPSSHVLVKRSVLATITAATVNGLVVDTQGFTRAMAVFDSAPSGAGTTSDCKLQEGTLSDGSDMADVATATFTQVTTTGGAKVQVADIDLNVYGRKRYLRLVHTGAGGSAAGAACGEIHLFNPRNAPVSQSSAIPFQI